MILHQNPVSILAKSKLFVVCEKLFSNPDSVAVLWGYFSVGGEVALAGDGKKEAKTLLYLYF